MNSKISHSRSVVAAVLVSLAVTACGGGGSGGNKNPGTTPEAAEWLLPTNVIVDGGPGRDGIPALQSPNFESVATIGTVGASDLAVAVRYNGEVKIYPHDILNWHEIVNDGPADDPYILSYCPLTGSAMAWEGDPSAADPTFGVSGLLYESNLILYDRQTDSNWAQMLEESVEGSRSGDVPNRPYQSSYGQPNSVAYEAAGNGLTSSVTVRSEKGR